MLIANKMDDMPISTKDLELYKSEAKSDRITSDGGPVMPLTSHLEELRTKIIISIVALCVGVVVSFYLSKDLISFLIKIAPSGTTFLQIKPGEFFFTSLRIAFYFGLTFALPVILWQLGSFILPGLSEKEKKVSFPVIISSPVLFALGSLFAYFFVAPSMLNFLFGFGKNVIPTSISIEHFISFTLMIMAICGFAFLLPVLLISLASVGIVNSKMLFLQWRYAVIISLVLGAILTPTPDPFNMLIIAAVLAALYLFSMIVLRTLAIH